MDTNKSTELIQTLQAFAPDTLNGAVIYHMNKETKKIQTISPICPVCSIQELYEQLSACRDGIQGFLNQLVDKGLAKN